MMYIALDSYKNKITYYFMMIFQGNTLLYVILELYILAYKINLAMLELLVYTFANTVFILTISSTSSLTLGRKSLLGLLAKIKV